MDWLQKPAEFQMEDSSRTSLGMHWESWLSYLENYFELIAATKPSVKRALLLLHAGTEVLRLYNSLPVAELEGADEYELAKATLNSFFKPKVNPDLATCIFCGTKQEKGEDIYSFYARLEYLASSCEFADSDREIRRQIINGCRSEKLREHIFSNKGITRTEILKVARDWELEHQQHREIKAMLRKLRVEEERATDASTAGDSQSHGQKRPCNNCGGSLPHKNKCPARGVICQKCGKKNHYAVVCFSSGMVPTSVTHGRTRKAHQ